MRNIYNNPCRRESIRSRTTRNYLNRPALVAVHVSGPLRKTRFMAIITMITVVYTMTLKRFEIDRVRFIICNFI